MQAQWVQIVFDVLAFTQGPSVMLLLAMEKSCAIVFFKSMEMKFNPGILAYTIPPFSLQLMNAQLIMLEKFVDALCKIW